MCVCENRDCTVNVHVSHLIFPCQVPYKCACLLCCLPFVFQCVFASAHDPDSFSLLTSMHPLSLSIYLSRSLSPPGNTMRRRRSSSPRRVRSPRSRCAAICCSGRPRYDSRARSRPPRYVCTCVLPALIHLHVSQLYLQHMASTIEFYPA